MAAGLWKVCNKAKKKLANGTISLAGTSYGVMLVKTLGATPEAVSLVGSFTEVASGNGYASSGKALTSERWTGADAVGDTTMMFDVGDVVWTATGGNITSIKGAVIFHQGAGAGSCHALCYSTLTGTQFTLASGNTLTIQMAGTGVFELY